MCTDFFFFFFFFFFFLNHPGDLSCLEKKVDIA